MLNWTWHHVIRHDIYFLLCIQVWGERVLYDSFLCLNCLHISLMEKLILSTGWPNGYSLCFWSSSSDNSLWWLFLQLFCSWFWHLIWWPGIQNKPPNTQRLKWRNLSYIVHIFLLFVSVSYAVKKAFRYFWLLFPFYL